MVDTGELTKDQPLWVTSKAPVTDRRLSHPMG